MIAVLLFAIIAIYIVLIVAQYCWNETVSPIFDVSKITLWQTLLLLVLSNLLFKSSTQCENACVYVNDKMKPGSNLNHNQPKIQHLNTVNQ
jgi:hypothetical protein